MTKRTMTEAPKMPNFRARQSEWNTYFKKKAAWEAQQARLAQGLTAVEPKARDYMTVKQASEKLVDMGYGWAAEGLLKAAAEFGVKTVKLNAISEQEAGSTLTNAEKDKWRFVYRPQGSKMLAVNTDGENTMHAGSNRNWGIEEKRTFPGETAAFRFQYRYVSQGPAWAMSIYMFKKAQEQLSTSSTPTPMLDSGK